MPDTKTHTSSGNGPGEGLSEKINLRYTRLAEVNCCLSCGGALDLAEVAPGETFLDLGCGRGADVMKAARRIGPEAMAWGVDDTEAMLKIATETAGNLGLSNCRFVKGNIEQKITRLPDQSVDVIISNCTINHARDKAAVYREIARLLKRGGRFVVSDVLAVETLPEEVRSSEDAWAGCYGGAIPRGEYFNSIAAAGFAELEILEESEPYKKGAEDVDVFSITLRGYRR